MTEKQFWACTPRKLQVLSKAHAEYNGAKKDSEDKDGYIDQVL